MNDILPSKEKLYEISWKLEIFLYISVMITYKIYFLRNWYSSPLKFMSQSNTLIA
jgi:hypothetical protein